MITQEMKSRGEIITVATLLWDRNEHSYSFSEAYDESWVEKLFAGFRDKLTRPMRFVVFTDRPRAFSTSLIEQLSLESPRPLTYSACIEPYRLNTPTILVGLDTIVTGSCDELADYCFYADRPAVPRDPIFPEKLCNGVALIPEGWARVWTELPPGKNDMEWVRELSADGRWGVIDDLFPGQVNSYKKTVKQCGVGDSRIVYFHGHPKAPELQHVGWIARAWSDGRGVVK